MSKWHFIGVAFVLIGTLYLRKPNLFRRGIWLKTSIAIRTLSPETYGKYMRGLGMLLIICGICAFIYGFFDAEPYLLRHQSGDWGDLSEIDKRENDFSLLERFRLMSAYHLNDQTKIWVITERDRNATTILLPEEY